MSADGANTGLYEANTWNFGVKGGATFGFFGDNQVRLGEGSKKGLAGGGYAQYNQKSWLSWRVEVWYQQVGAANMRRQFDNRFVETYTQLYGPTVQTGSLSNFTLHQVEVPFQVVVRPPVFRKFAPSIYAGYSIAYNAYVTDERIETYRSDVSELVGTPGTFREVNRVTLNNVSEQFEELEHAINMGIGMTYPITDKDFNLVFDLRYRLGLSQLSQGVRMDSPEDGGKITDLNTDTIMISVGIEF